MASTPEVEKTSYPEAADVQKGGLTERVEQPQVSAETGSYLERVETEPSGQNVHDDSGAVVLQSTQDSRTIGQISLSDEQIKRGSKVSWVEAFRWIVAGVLRYLKMKKAGAKA